MRVELRPGCTVVYEGEQLQVEALNGPLVRLRRTQAELNARWSSGWPI